MKKNIIITLSLCLILVLTYVVSSIAEVKVIDTYTEVTHEELSSDVLENEIFIEGEVGEIRLYIQDGELDKMYSDPLAEEYIFANKVIVNGNEVENVGIRTKGNSSLGQVVSSGSERYSFKISFDEYDKGQDFYGLNQLILNNNFGDPSYLREYLSYYIFREMGLPAPRTSYAEVYINDELKGLYLVVEPVDEAFVGTNFENADGDLYKPYMLDFGWQGDSIEDYGHMNLKTNEDSTDHSAFLNLIDVINNGGDLEAVLNVDNILKYLAVTVGVVSLDSYPGAIPHNFYIYEEDGKFSIIPWDFNQGFGGFSAKLDREQLVNYMIFDPTSGPMESRPLVEVLFQNQEYVDRYEEYIKELINGPMSYENMEKIIDEVSTMIAPYVERDPSKFFTYEQFLIGLEKDQSIESAAPVGNNNIERTPRVPQEGGNKGEKAGNGKGSDKKAPSKGGENSGEMNRESQEREQGQAPAKGQGEAPMKGQGKAPGMGQDQAPAKVQGEAQGEAQGKAPAKGERQVQEQAQGKASSKGEEQASSKGQTNQGNENSGKGNQVREEQNQVSNKIIYGLKEFIRDRINSIEGQLNGTIKSYNDGNGNGGQSRGADGQPR
ncbi:CotH kinase family protein [Oceanirhabdus sp. W0125-5]|uniref:CotH kinase family protein n=1 Tax=Oceanirhabdus sp. W0125-5 TaxID=2999116 RepID=UPI0022F2DC86|nr:CotH kinase family protein [Oceanirhabdus sp. W0125-5]WBW99076.1 CotH kinase family protein [Oceanirhabdus sp. W0125-5]